MGWLNMLPQNCGEFLYSTFLDLKSENFGAVLDSVGAVLVQCVKDVVPLLGISTDPDIIAIKRNIEKGDGIGWKLIHKKEPSLPAHSVQAALSVFRSTDEYLKLLKKGRTT